MPNVETHEWPDRTDIHAPDWRAVVWASVIAGSVFAALEMVGLGSRRHVAVGAAAHDRRYRSWDPTPTPPDTFNAKVVGAAVVIHMVLALIYGVILAFIIQHLDRTWAIIAGALFALALYGINFYGFTATYPWFADARVT